MLRQLLTLALTIIILLTAFVAAEVWLSSAFQICIQQNARGSLPVVDYMRCSGNFIADNNGGMTAFATLVVAMFTATLWMATTRQARLTEEALISNNRAFVFVPGIGQFWEWDAVTGQYNWRLRPILRNTGNTPTRQMTMFVECEIRIRHFRRDIFLQINLSILRAEPFHLGLNLVAASSHGCRALLLHRKT